MTESEEQRILCSPAPCLLKSPSGQLGTEEGVEGRGRRMENSAGGHATELLEAPDPMPPHRSAPQILAQLPNRAEE